MQTAQHKRPLWVGLLLAAMSPALCIALPAALVQSNPSLKDILVGGAIFFAASFPIALAAALAIGLPFLLWLRSRKWLNVVVVIAGSIIIGAAVLGLLSWALTWDHRSPELLQFVLGAGFGLVAGVACCVGAGITIRSSRKPIATRLFSA
jgi:hypothetical protein